MQSHLLSYFIRSRRTRNRSDRRLQARRVPRLRPAARRNRRKIRRRRTRIGRCEKKLSRRARAGTVIRHHSALTPLKKWAPPHRQRTVLLAVRDADHLQHRRRVGAEAALNPEASRGRERFRRIRPMTFARECRCSSRTTCRSIRLWMRKSVFLKTVRPLHHVTLKNKSSRSRKPSASETWLPKRLATKKTKRESKMI